MPEIIKCSLLLVTPTNLCHCLYLHTSAASKKNDINHIRKIMINSRKNYWVKSGYSGDRVNSDIHLQTVKSQMSLIRNFNVCLVDLFFIPIQTRLLSEFT